MSKPFCGKCRHYVRHYIHTEKGYDMIDCGHCEYQDVSIKLDDCPMFEKIHRDEIEVRLSKIEQALEKISLYISVN